MTTTLFILLYVVMYVATYYFCRWTVIKRFGSDAWEWVDVYTYLFLSIFIIFTAVIQFMEYIEVFKIRSITIKKPKWL